MPRVRSRSPGRVKIRRVLYVRARVRARAKVAFFSYSICFFNILVFSANTLVYYTAVSSRIRTGRHDV